MFDHRQQRALERYGVVLTLKDLDFMNSLVTPQNLIRRDGASEVHAISWRGRCFIVACRQLNQLCGRLGIVTFLPSDELDAKARRRKLIESKGKCGRATGWRRNLALRKRHADRQEAHA
jgi:hypothetical protein